MIVYSETKKMFINDVFNGELPEIIEENSKSSAFSAVVKRRLGPGAIPFAVFQK